MKFVFLAAAILFEVIGTSALKASDGFTRVAPSVVVVAGYAAAFYFLSLSLREIPVGIAYAIWSGAGIILIAAIGWLFFGQTLDAWAMLGLGLIILGVIVVNFLSKSGAH